MSDQPRSAGDGACPGSDTSASLAHAEDIFDELARSVWDPTAPRSANFERETSDPALVLLMAMCEELAPAPQLDLERLLTPVPVPSIQPQREGRAWGRRIGGVLAGLSLLVPLTGVAYAAGPDSPLYPVRVVVFGPAAGEGADRAQVTLARTETLPADPSADTPAAPRPLRADRSQTDRAQGRGAEASTTEARARLVSLRARLDPSAPARPAGTPQVSEAVDTSGAERPSARTPESPTTRTEARPERPTRGERAPAGSGEDSKSPKTAKSAKDAKDSKSPKTAKSAKDAKSSKTAKDSKSSKASSSSKSSKASSSSKSSTRRAPQAAGRPSSPQKAPSEKAGSGK